MRTRSGSGGARGSIKEYGLYPVISALLTDPPANIPAGAGAGMYVVCYLWQRNKILGY
jgi:hypothetical protein